MIKKNNLKNSTGYSLKYIWSRWTPSIHSRDGQEFLHYKTSIRPQSTLSSSFIWSSQFIISSKNILVPIAWIEVIISAKIFFDGIIGWDECMDRDEGVGRDW